MGDFTKSDFTYKGVSYKRYTADRKRGGETWVFYGEVPHDTTYSPTWAAAVSADVTLSGVFFLSKIEEDNICVDFLIELTTNQETALGTLYTNHVAPVAV